MPSPERADPAALARDAAVEAARVAALERWGQEAERSRAHFQQRALAAEAEAVELRSALAAVREELQGTTLELAAATSRVAQLEADSEAADEALEQAHERILAAERRAAQAEADASPAGELDV